MYIIKEFENRYNEEVNNFVISVFVEEYGFEKFRKGLEIQNNQDYINNGGNLWIALDEDENVIGTIDIKKHLRFEGVFFHIISYYSLLFKRA